MGNGISLVLPGRQAGAQVHAIRGPGTTVRVQAGANGGVVEHGRRIERIEQRDDATAGGTPDLQRAFGARGSRRIPALACIAEPDLDAAGGGEDAFGGRLNASGISGVGLSGGG
jgi:hypothetical protein